MGTDGQGLNLLNPYNSQVHTIPNHNFSDNAILCALNSLSGKVWLGTYSGGINVYDPETEKVIIYDSEDGLKSNDVRALLETNDGNIWIGTNGDGLHFYDSKTKMIRHVAETEYIDIRDIELGEDGKLWLATFGNGLAQYDPKTRQIDFYNWYTEGEYTPVAFTVYV